MALHLTCAFPTGYCCYTWGLWAVWCGWVRSEAGAPGAVGHGHSLQPGLIWHKQDGLALHRALLSASMGSLSSAGNSHPPVCRRWGEREGNRPGPEPWLALQAAPCCPVSAKPSLWPGLIPDHLFRRVFTASCA